MSDVDLATATPGPPPDPEWSVFFPTGHRLNFDRFTYTGPVLWLHNAHDPQNDLYYELIGVGAIASVMKYEDAEATIAKAKTQARILGPTQ